MANAFMRAYGKTRRHLNESPAAEIAATEIPYFRDTDEAVLDTLGHAGGVTERYRYEQICAGLPI